MVSIDSISAVGGTPLGMQIFEATKDSFLNVASTPEGAANSLPNLVGSRSAELSS